MRFARPLASLGLGLTLTIASASTAFANNIDQEGKSTPGATTIDGTTVDITPSSFNPANQQCVIYAALVSDVGSGGTVLRHIETGVVRCLNATIMNTCTSGYRFTEKYTGTGYECAVGSMFTNGNVLNAMIQRTSGTSAMWGSTGGSYNSQTGFAQGDDIRAAVWAEATGLATTCPASPHSARFANWNKFQNATGWSAVSTPSSYRYIRGITNAPCWSVGTVSGGAFNVA